DLALENGKPDPDQARLRAIQEEIAQEQIALEGLEDEAADEQSELVFKQLAVLLSDSEGNSPDPNFLADSLDQNEVGPLMTWLLSDGSAEGEAEKTTTTTST